MPCQFSHFSSVNSNRVVGAYVNLCLLPAGGTVLRSVTRESVRPQNAPINFN